MHDNLRHLGLEAMDVVNLRGCGGAHGLAKARSSRRSTALAELQRQG